jgi:hypothetical protein
MAQLWEVSLLPHPCSQPLLLFLPSFTESLAPCPTPVHQGQVQCSTPPLMLMLDYNLLFMLFSFFGGRSNLPRRCAGLCSLGVGRGVMCGAFCSHAVSADLCRQLWNWLVGKNGVLLFSRQTLPVIGFGAAGHKKAFHRLGVQDIAKFDSGWCSIFCLFKEKKGEKWPGAFYPRADTPCCLRSTGISWLLGAIIGCFKGQSLNFMCT